MVNLPFGAHSTTVKHLFAKARAYELPSLSGAESANIVIYLMQLTNPSAEVIQSIESAVQWFKDSEIKGIKIESFINKDGKKDRRVAPCEDCKPMWARFYELETNRPFSATGMV